MARNDSQQNDQVTPRVYKANAVHKRRAGGRKPVVDPVRSDAFERALEAQEPKLAASAETPVSSSSHQLERSDDLAISSSPCHSERSEESPRSGLPESPLRGDPSPSAQDDNMGAAQDDNMGTGRDDNTIAPRDDNAITAQDGGGEAAQDDKVDQKGDSLLVHSDDESSVDAADEPSEASKTRQRKKVRPRTVVLAIFTVVVVIVVAAVSLFAWNRWGRYNDSEDFKGTWYVQGTAVPVTIDDSLIHLADDVAYSYAIDERDKTISYSFGDWTGQGRYRFSVDRSTLVITDGSDFTGTGNTADDFARMLEELKLGGSSSEAGQVEEDGSIALSRTAPTVAFVAQQVKDRAAQEKAAAEEDLDEDVYDYYY